MVGGRVVRTNSFGYFRFTDVPAGETYIFTAADKRYTFSEPSQVHFISEACSDILFVASQEPGGSGQLPETDLKDLGGNK